MKDCIYKGTATCVRGKYKGQQRLASPQSKETIKYLFNHIYDYALEARIVERNYAREFTLDKKVFQEKEKNYKSKVPFSKEEIDKLWKSIEFVPFADMIVYACYSGWRPTELIKLKIKGTLIINILIITNLYKLEKAVLTPPNKKRRMKKRF